MPSNLAEVLAGTAELAITYLLHSTLLLGAVWALVRTQRIGSQTLRECMWKTAAVLPLVTAATQCAGRYSDLALDLSSGITRPIKSSGKPRTNLKEPKGDAHASADDECELCAGIFRASERSTGMIGGPTHTAVHGGGPSDELTDSAMSEQRHAIMSASAGSASVDAYPEDGSALGAAIALGETQSARPPKMPSGGFFASIVAVVFLCGGLLRVTIETILFRRRLADSRIVERGAALEMLRRMIKSSRLNRRVLLLVSDVFPEPAAFGLFRWRIVLPEGIDRELPRDELRALLGHELAHLVRGDAWWLWIGRVLCSCLAFQPLNFVARRGWQRASECRCDDWAVRHGADGLSLARCLTRIAERRLAFKSCANILAAGGSRSTLSRRIERLLNGGTRDDGWGTPTGARVLASAVVCLGIALIAFGPRTELFAEATEAADVHGGVADSESAGESTELSFEPLELPESFRRLHEELDQLDRRLALMNDLVARDNSSVQIRELAEPLRRRTEDLQHHRQTLLTEWVKYGSDN